MRSFGAGDQRLHFINRGDPNSGLYLILLLVLATQVLGGRELPEPRQIIAVLGSFIIATTIHEFMHAYTAWRLGDTTARDLGRITLNPLMHFEPFGFFGMVMISLGYGFIGWGKPVPVNPNRLGGIGILQRQRGMALVAAAGPISNVVQAFVAAVPLRLAGWTLDDLFLLLVTGRGPGGGIEDIFGWFLWVNVLLASFNMIPIPPLDGHKILTGLLPNFWYPVLAPLERYGFLILFGLFFISGRIGGEGITSAMISPVRDTLFRLLF